MKHFYYLCLLFSSLILSCKEADFEPKNAVLNLEAVYHFDEIKEGNFIVQFSFDRNGVLWIATFNNGLLRVENGNVVAYNTSNSTIAGDMINDLFIDHENQVWVGTDLGFSVFKENSWLTYNMVNVPLFRDLISEICINKKGQILVGNGSSIGGGLSFFDGSEWKGITPGNSALPSSIINEIETDANGDFWIGTAMFQGSGGLTKLSDGEIRQVYSQDQSELLYNAVDHIEVNEQEVWLGYSIPYINMTGIADGGLQKISLSNEKVESFFPYDTKLLSNRIKGLKVTSSGDIWFITTPDDPFCIDCISGIGLMDKQGQFTVYSGVNDELPLNQYFAWLDEYQSEIYVASEREIMKVVRTNR
ncbi:hypothetical protein QQ008_00715 [Fulvivirgaceae bacterium BMA10]|uniref:Two component regulator propeller n=1 Tax=Splendidivirga corallicola TaxID=3051826 RepID=A0ABT8KGK6_9BACT|nr:hypothetical protein [Fulvivirgaceae bacterium BMA10]